MNKRKLRREQALKREKRKKLVKVGIIAGAVLVVAIFITIIVLGQTGNRVFTADDQSVLLRNNGTFVAQLAHEVVKEGTFGEHWEDGVVMVTFEYDDNAATGWMDGDVLVIPDEWGDDHSHGTGFALARGRQRVPRP